MFFLEGVKSTMNHSLLLQTSRTQLVKQLLYFDEERNGFLNHYYPGKHPQRKQAEELINRYCTVLEQLLSDYSEEKLCSSVLIGSRLDLRYLADGYIDTYTIVFPAYTDPAEGKISWLSPLGMQLLMAQRNLEYELEVPSGKISVMIDNISFENSGEVDSTV